MPRVTYIEASGVAHVIDVPLGENVMRGAVYNDVPGIVGECGGASSCATCRCYVDETWTAKVGGPVTSAERDLLMAAEDRLPVMFAHIALLKALNIWKPRPAPSPRKKAAKRYKVIR